MIKEIKHLIYISIIIFFIFLTGKYYFSDTNKKNSFRSLNDIDKKIRLYSQNIPILKDNTQNIIEYTESIKTKKKKYHFWKLINKDD